MKPKPEGLELALFESVAEKTGATVEQVADVLYLRHNVPSDYFFAAFDNEVATLADRFEDAKEKSNED